MKIAVVGLGYVGLSNAALLSKNHDVVALDIDQGRVNAVNRRQSPIEDVELEAYLATQPATHAVRHHGPEFIVVATPTDYDPDTNFFDTSSVESVISDVLVIRLPPGSS